MAESLVGSEIIKLAGEIKARIAQGESIFNLTIGDFNPEIFPIPEELLEGILAKYRAQHTNYPAANGMESLRVAVADFMRKRQGLDYTPNEVLIAGGARPLIYAAYQALVDPEDIVVFPVPSWNNNHYTHLSRGKGRLIMTGPETHFMPNVDLLKDALEGARMLALCSPLNPTGTVFSKEQLNGICELVLKINMERLAKNEKPLYLLFDQIYWQLTHGDTQHFDPVSLLPELRPFTIYIDGISKAFAATGVRVGWAMGPEKIMNKMKSILGHVGAWSPKAEQLACAEYLEMDDAVDTYLADIKTRIMSRLNGFYQGFQELKRDGYPVDAIAPQAAIYLTAQLNLVGMKTQEGGVLEDVAAVTDYVLREAGLAIVPFYAFGAERSSTWYRISVGTAQESDAHEVCSRLRTALEKLS
ncbi:MAG: aminotransferase class I/II-fold pyridoxal phosphate-dependent enzyme [Bacteroidetes bacterium]|nr:aminotransferase class I/II-fold pyridoxal phosphate-dependent enzyme [Bacteroidota bacterium]